MYKTVLTLYMNIYVHIYIYTYINLTPPDMFIHACFKQK